jgi:hypothetical protein
VPMPTGPRAEQSRTRGPVPGMPPGAKDQRRPSRAGHGEEDCAGCCLWPYGPAFVPCPPAVAYFEVSKDPAITIQRHWRQFPPRMAGFGTTFSEAARRPQGRLSVRQS